MPLQNIYEIVYNPKTAQGSYSFPERIKAVILNEVEKIQQQIATELLQIILHSQFVFCYISAIFFMYVE